MSTQASAITPAAKTLQERLHELLTRLAATVELIKNWKESDGDDASIHVETTTKLIAAIQAVIDTTKKVDGVMKNDAELRASLQSCLVPLDLLDLLDHGNGLNPDCFSRALLKEALGQLAGLKRRKLALEMLGAAVQTGLRQRGKKEKETASESVKRKREEDTGTVKTEEASQEPPVKKQNTADSAT